MRKLLNENVMHVSESFTIEDTLQMITIILGNNVFSFGDAQWLQERGVAMGTPVACVSATFFSPTQK